MDKWKERLVEMLMVRNELYKADKGQLWEYHYPEVAAKISEILLAQEKLQIKLSQDYIEFLLCANGGSAFINLRTCLGRKILTRKICHLQKRY